jgi:hypothetical protein
MTHVFVRLVLGVAAASGFIEAALAASVADAATSRYIVRCETSASPGAVYECALSAAVQGGAIARDVAQACEADVATMGASTKRSREKWQCAQLRQLGSQMPYEEWHKATFRDCGAQAERAGHRYQGQHYQCVVDSMVDHKRATASQLENCRQTSRSSGAHGLLNCLSEAQKRTDGDAAPVRSPSPRERSEANRVAASQDQSRNSIAQCQAYLQQNPMPPPMSQIFLSNCTGAKAPPATVATMASKASTSIAAEEQRGNADYPPEKVRASSRTSCEAHNVRGILRFDCNCIVREADGHLKEGRLPSKSIAAQQFDTSPCIDRVRSAERIVAANFTEGTQRMMQNAGVNVDAMKTCQRRAIETQIDAKDLLDASRLRAELAHHCPAQIKR